MNSLTRHMHILTAWQICVTKYEVVCCASEEGNAYFVFSLMRSSF